MDQPSSAPASPQGDEAGAWAAGDPRRLRGLDVLRGVAILLVLWRHVPFVLDPAILGPLGNAWWWRGGWVGVDLFFVLSGFLVSGLIFREHARTGRFAPWRFLGRRGFKIYPGFYVMLLATLGLDPDRGRAVAWSKVLHEAVFVQNYLPGLWLHTWSLAVEEHFYLLLALALWCLGRRRSERPFAAVVPAAGVTLVVCLLLRLEAASRSTTLGPVFFPTHLRLDGLLLGVALSHVFHYDPDAAVARLGRRWPWVCLLLGAALLLPAFAFPMTWLVITAGLTQFALGSGLLLLGGLHAQAPGAVGRSLATGLAWIGSRSYAIYLWHMLLGTLAHDHLVRAWPTCPAAMAMLVYGAATVGGGAALAWLVEAPFLRMRERLLPARRPGRAGRSVPDPGLPG